MGKRKCLAENPTKLAAIACKLEGGKSQIKMGDMNQAMKLIVAFETALTVAGYKSAIMMLKKKANADAAEIKKKNPKKAKALALALKAV